jgi:heptosyltransferase III
VPASAYPGSEGPARDPQLTKRLIIRPGAIGDCIVSLPAIETLKSDYTEVWVPSQNVPMIRFADRVRSIASTGLDLVGFEGLAGRALSELEQFDSIVSWYGANRQDFKDAVANLPFEFHAALPEGPAVHAVDFYMRQVGGRDGAIPRIACPRRDGGYVAIHPFSGSASKNWPLENFLSLAGRLRLPVEFCAGPEEPLEGARRFEDLGAVASWLAAARAYVGNDSGISHLAAAVGTPVVAIFRTTNPDVWAPRGENVVILREPDIEQVRLAVLPLC